jgi:hypothetical protein
MTVYVWGPKDKSPKGVEVVNTTSRSINWSRGLSPFFLGPCELYSDYIASNVENGWQFSKVYQEHVDTNGNPTPKYFNWALSGWSNPQAIRYPMGKGRKPLYSLWNSKQLSYVESRKAIYVPLYAKAVVQTEAYSILRELYKKKGEIHLWDFDGYNYHKLGMTFKDVINDPNKKMGHAFVLANLLVKGY